MSTYDLLLAVSMLTSPPGTPEAIPTREQWPGLQSALHKTALDWELLDPRETRYVLARVEDFECDLNLLRRRHVELADAPKMADSARFPDRATVNELIRFNRAYRKHLENRMIWEQDRAIVLHEALAETDRLYGVWDAVRDARCDFYYVTVRRQALLKLRTIVGEEAYATGDLPPSVPEWQFSAVR